MNKKLLAAALSAAFVAPAAFADVTTYGVLNNSVEFVKATGATDASKDVKSVNRVSSNTSRIGFKGWEDLGGGLKAIWQVEQGIGLDGDGTSTWASRNSFIGLQGDFGRVLLGRHDSAYKTMTIGLGLNVLGDGAADTCSGGATAGMFCRGDTRMTNSVHYYSNVVGGFSAGASYGADETRATIGGNRANAHVLSLGGKYVVGGLSVAAAYENRNDAAGGVGLDTEFYKLVAAYKLGDTTLGAGYERSDIDQAGSSSKKQDGYTLAVSHKLGAWGVGASYTWLGKEKNGAEADAKAKQWVLAGTYDLSKRTQVQAYATQIKNQKSAARNFAINPLSGVSAGSDPQAIGLGIRHLF